MEKKYVVLRNRERSSMVSNWDELLCVGFGSVKPYKLYLGTFEILGERSEFYDDEADECILPDDINGKAVRGSKGDMVIGYEVENASYRPADEFEFDEPSECEGWLAGSRWVDDRLLAELNSAVVKLGQPKAGIDRPDSMKSRF
jgi:hypothetical protein